MPQDMILTGETLAQILTAIEEYCGDEFCEELDMVCASEGRWLDPGLRQANERLVSIYKIAHAFNPSNSCYHAHEAWRKAIDKKDAA